MLNVKDLKKMDKDDLLSLFGLETRRTAVDSLWPTLGIFAAGVMIGAGVGMLLAPKSGMELRDDLRTRLQGGQGAFGQGIGSSASVGTPSMRTDSGRL